MDKFREIKRILILVLVFNWLVAFSKIIYGLITKCASMTADGVHSFGDGASNIIGLIGIWMAARPKDESHPYGHKKFETAATLGIAVILFIASFNIFKDAISRVAYPVVPDVTKFSFVLMIVTLFINMVVMKYEYNKGVHLSSDILVSDSLHTKSDIFATLVVIGTLISVRLGFPLLDTIAAALIALLIAKSGISILQNSFSVLCDEKVVSVSKISGIVKAIPGVKSAHKIRTRGRKDDIHVDLHVTVDTKMHVDAAHDISHEIQKVLKAKISGITDVIVHIEPSS